MRERYLSSIYQVKPSKPVSPNQPHQFSVRTMRFYLRKSWSVRMTRFMSWVKALRQGSFNWITRENLLGIWVSTAFPSASENSYTIYSWKIPIWHLHYHHRQPMWLWVKKGQYSPRTSISVNRSNVWTFPVWIRCYRIPCTQVPHSQIFGWTMKITFIWYRLPATFMNMTPMAVCYFSSIPKTVRWNKPWGWPIPHRGLPPMRRVICMY